MELKRYLGAVRRRLWLVIVLGILAMGAAAAFVVLKADPPKAQESVLFFLPDTESSGTGALVNFMNQQIETVTSLTKSEAVDQKVIDEVGLDTDLETFRQNTSAERVTDTNTVTFAYADADTDQGTHVVRTLVDEVLKQYQDTLGEPTARIVSQIDTKIAELEPQINEVDRQIAAFLADRGIGSIDSARQAQASIIERLTQLRDAIVSGNQLGSSGTANQLLDQHRAEISELAQDEVTVNELLRKKKVLEARLDALIQQQSDARKNEASLLSKVQVQTLGEPQVVTEDTKGKALRVLAAGILGALFGAVVAILMDLVDRSVSSVEDAEELSGFPVLAVIPSFDRDDDGSPARSGTRQQTSGNGSDARQSRQKITTS
ncbi:MAG: hypothetical protein K1X95_10615 [Acidimicrobiia bacterium]|nr:hypothetical protein [Acidimicrobiia bacterium]